MATVTRLLRRYGAGDDDALQPLMELVVPELHRIAAAQFRRESRAITLQPTALVNEYYLRLVGAKEVDWEDRSQFLGFAARVMRQILVDHARRRGAEKRGGGEAPVTLTDASSGSESRVVDLLALDAALQRLARLDPRQHQVAELRYFVGLTVEEIAGLLGVGTATVKRDWSHARAWLKHELGGR